MLQRRHPGHNEAWNFTDINYMASAGVSVNGEAGQRSGDTFGLAGVMSGISHQNQEFLEARGSGILDDDGPLSYGWEKVLKHITISESGKLFMRLWIPVHQQPGIAELAMKGSSDTRLGTVNYPTEGHTQLAYQN